MESKESELSRESIKLFLALLLLVGVFLAGGGALVYRADLKESRSEAETRERQLVALAAGDLVERVQRLAGNLRLIAQDAGVLAAFTDSPEEAPAGWGKSTARLETDAWYAELALVKPSGQEVWRAERTGGAPAGAPAFQVVMAEELGSRVLPEGEFGVAALGAGQVMLFSAPAMAGAESGGSEVFQAVTPVLDGVSGERLGYVIAACRKPDFIGQLSDIGELNGAEFKVIDGRGRLLFSLSETLARGGQAGAGTTTSFAARHPAVWATIERLSAGQLYQDSGLYSFTTLSLEDALGRGAPGPDGAWILVSKLAAAEIAAASRGTLKRLWLIGLVLFALLGVGAWFLADAFTKWRFSQRRLRELAYHDSLTGLPNRALFFDRFERIHVHSARYRRRYAMISVDLDDFKAVNDRFGHVDGDQLLLKISRMLVHSLRKADTVARTGGDEFSVLLSEVSDVDAAHRLGEKVVAAIAAPIRLTNGEVEIGASVGVAVFPEHGETGEAMLRAVDQALHRAKAEGKGRCVLAQGAIAKDDEGVE